jgi:oxygen-dependent protoporphyrinogen oxidase
VTHLAVIGGGITGLAAAYELTRRPDPPDVTLFEAGPSLGGKIRTSPFAGLPAVDEGADAFLTRVPWGVELTSELGLDDLVAPASQRAYIWWERQMHAIPEGFVLGVPTGLTKLARSGLLGLGGTLRAALEPFVPRGRVDEDNLGALVRHRFGAPVLERLVDPLIGSVNAGDADELSLAATAPAVAEAAARSRSLVVGLRRRPAPASGPVFLAPRAGMGALVDALTHHLASRLDRVDIRQGEPVTTIEPDGRRWRVNGVAVDAALLALPAFAAAELLRDLAPETARGLAGITYASVVMVTLAFPASAPGRPLDGTGHLVPKPVQRHVTAASWASTKWAHWQPPGQVVLRASLGRHGDEHAIGLDDDAVVAATLADLGDQLGIRDAPTEVRLSRWPRSFPQYAPGHLDRIAAIERALAREAPGLAVAGAAARGLGVPACIRQGREWAVATMRAPSC